MEKIGLNELRRMFQEFYQSKEHFARSSFPLVPEKDKSLLLINSGMAPLKPYFAGLETPPSKRMTTCQKCIRTGDIDNVGFTARHATFFEMLGSFSFGDYFKKESLLWGWEFITEVLKMPVDRLWASIYEEDQEAHDLWKDMIGLPEGRIVPLGKDDNFWEIGVGPCGPCSEIYFDRGEQYGCDKPDCKPGCECDRYVEFWNHVFTQFNRDAEGNYTKLSHPNIDTGMGLERLACIMQEVDSIFDVDTIRYILDAVVAVSGVTYHEGQASTDVSIRIVTDHIRSVTFMIGDGILPSNEGRGYVLRRLLRRAARHGKLLGVKGPFLADLSKKVIEISGTAYTELYERADYIYKVLTVEEAKFSETIDQGTLILHEFMRELAAEGGKVLNGEKIFKLYDTYGFPLELTQEILEESSLQADVEGFHQHMQHQKEMARSARKSDTDAGWAEEFMDLQSLTATVFKGYETLSWPGVVLELFSEQGRVATIQTGETGMIVLDQTPFYAESGGQTGDKGLINGIGFQAKVTDTTKMKNVVIHHVEIVSGEARALDQVNAIVDPVSRNSTARNHTATHLLHKALKEVLGQHIEQAGSSVSPGLLRFDFTHFEPISKDDLQKVEEIVNLQILSFLPVSTNEMPIEEAMKTGATALFGEKYGAKVRVVSVGDYSTELCGGTHIANAGQIGALKILSESGVAAGVRRIEAVTGLGLYQRSKEEEQLIHKASDALKTNPASLLQRIASLTDEIKSTKKELDEFKKKAMGSELDDLLGESTVINQVRLIRKKFEDYDINDLRKLSDEIKSRLKGTILVFATVNDGKVTFMVSVSDDLLEKGYHAGNLIKQIAAAAGGGGGGKADMAQAGAKDPSKIDNAFALAETLL